MLFICLFKKREDIFGGQLISNRLFLCFEHYILGLTIILKILILSETVVEAIVDDFR